MPKSTPDATVQEAPQPFALFNLGYERGFTTTKRSLGAEEMRTLQSDVYTLMNLASMTKSGIRDLGGTLSHVGDGHLAGTTEELQFALHLLEQGMRKIGNRLDPMLWALNNGATHAG